MFEEFISLVRDIYNTKEDIPLHTPIFDGNEKLYLNECIDTSFVSSVGNFVTQFENEISKYTGAKHAVAIVNGTSALHIALVLSGVKCNDEVITQPLTFIGTVNAISYTGAKTIFVDVDKDTMNLSPEKLSSFLKKNTIIRNKKCINKTTNRQIKVVIPMHTFGFPCKTDELNEICEKYNLVMIEDAAESLGSFYKNQHTGTFGLFGALSFNGNKTITTGGGGMLLTNDINLAKKAKHLTTTAKVSHPWEYNHDMMGYNYRLPNINAALGCAQLEKLSTILLKKRELSNIYKEFFNSRFGQYIIEPQNSKANYWLNAILLKSKQERDDFLTYTNKNGVLTRPIWKLINKLSMYKNCQSGDLENSLWLEERVVNIPSSATNS